MSVETFGQLTLRLVAGHPGAFRNDLLEWFQHEPNWLIWSAFRSQANHVWNSGRRHYSARTIGEFLRHETVLADTDADFKINDWIWPDLARLYMLERPERAGFFETRRRAAA